MKIVYLHQYFKSPKDSGGTRSYEMARRFVSAGHEVHVVSANSEEGTSGAISRGGWSVEVVDGVHVHRINVPYSNAMSFRRRVLAFMTFAFRSARRARSLRADVVFATSTPLTIILPAMYATAFRKTPIVFEVRDLWPELPIAVGALNSSIARFCAYRLEKLAYRVSTEVVALSPGMRDGVEASGYPRERITVIPNSSDLDLFGDSGGAGPKWRGKFDWLQDRPLVLYCGTLGLINRVGYLVELAAEMRLSFPDARFLVVGTGAERGLILSRAEELGVLGENFFLFDPVPKSEVPVIFSACTVSTSLFAPILAMESNSANKFFDGLAAGRPIVVNYGGWQKTVLEESCAGISIDPIDIRLAASQLGELLGDENRLQRMGIAARTVAETRFSRDILADQLLGVLKRSIEA